MGLVSEEEDNTPPARPQRKRQPPSWMGSKSWQFVARAIVPKKRRGYRRPLSRPFSHQVLRQANKINKVQTSGEGRWQYVMD